MHSEWQHKPSLNSKVRVVFPLIACLVNSRNILQEPSKLMDYLEKLLEKLRELAQKVIEVLSGPEVETEPELIPIPVNERRSRNYR